MGCLTITHSVDIGDFEVLHTVDRGSLDVQFSLICSVSEGGIEYDDVLFHVTGPLLVSNGYLLVQKN